MSNKFTDTFTPEQKETLDIYSEAFEGGFIENASYTVFWSTRELELHYDHDLSSTHIRKIFHYAIKVYDNNLDLTFNILLNTENGELSIDKNHLEYIEEIVADNFEYEINNCCEEDPENSDCRDECEKEALEIYLNAVYKVIKRKISDNLPA